MSVQSIEIRINDLQTRLAEAWRILALDAVKEEIAALEVEVSAPDFWNDQERARTESQKLSDLKKEYEAWNALRTELEELRELMALDETDEVFEKEAEAKMTSLEATYHSMEFAMLMRGPHDASNAVMAIHAGAGERCSAAYDCI
jgi:peptide chain release factor 2